MCISQELSLVLIGGIGVTHAEREDRTRDRRVMRPTRWQLRYFRRVCWSKLVDMRSSPISYHSGTPKVAGPAVLCFRQEPEWTTKCITMSVGTMIGWTPPVGFEPTTSRLLSGCSTN